MAVAADLHRDFLIPERARAPDNEYGFPYSDELRLFFCIQIIAHFSLGFKSFFFFFKEKSIDKPFREYYNGAILTVLRFMMNFCDTKHEKIKFRPVTLEDRENYMRALQKEDGRGCEFSFANLYLWGRQSISLRDGHILFFSQFDRRSVYPYPLGNEDPKAALDAIIADAQARGIPCRITGLSTEARQTLETLYPNRFRFHCDEAAFDYVYDINDLADLTGKKYHGKRNHLRRFEEAYPNYTTEPLNDTNLSAAWEMTQEWYKERLTEDPNEDFLMEQAALKKAFRDYRTLEMEGLILRNGDRLLAFTMASPLSKDTLDVHFEKAVSGVQGAYAAINREFARYIRNKYPHIRYLNREEDMGLEGLRKAKRSYHPHHMVEKYWGCLLEDGYEY